MNINIKNESMDLNIRLPSSLLKSDLFLTYAKVDKNTRRFIKQSYKILRKYSKKNKHFDFVEITKDNSKITIKI